MCQSKANGGRRCAAKTSPLQGLQARDFAKSLLSNVDLNANKKAALKSVDLSSIPQEEAWALWSEVAATEKPSVFFRALRESGNTSLSELSDVWSVPQDAQWHPEGDVGEHLFQAADEAAAKGRSEGWSTEDHTVRVLAALSHDLGKVSTTVVESDGKITSRGHDLEGAPIAMSLLYKMGGTRDVQVRVAALVRTHMRHINKPSAKSVAKLKRQLAEGGATLEDWIAVADADCMGRGAGAVHGVGDEWKKWL